MKDVINVLKPTVNFRIVLREKLSGENKGQKRRKENRKTKVKIMKRENNQAIYASQETGTNNSEEYDDIALMAIEDSQPENDADTKKRRYTFLISKITQRRNCPL